MYWNTPPCLLIVLLIQRIAAMPHMLIDAWHYTCNVVWYASTLTSYLLTVETCWYILFLIYKKAQISALMKKYWQRQFEWSVLSLVMNWMNSPPFKTCSTKAFRVVCWKTYNTEASWHLLCICLHCHCCVSPLKARNAKHLSAGVSGDLEAIVS